MTKLIKLPNGDWINPEYVISIDMMDDSDATEIRLMGQSSEVRYYFPGDKREELALLINGTKEEKAIPNKRPLTLR